ncbi:hypothetical protein N320_00198, partial [Buceros rhinoceros silvestris]
ELRAMLMVFQYFSEPINIVTDSAYVAGSISHLDKAALGQVNSENLFGILKLLWVTIQHCRQPYYIMHIRSHANLPGFIVEGSARANAAVAAVVMGPAPNLYQQAIESHKFFHQGSRALKRQFHLSHAMARAVIAACPDCQGEHVPQYRGVNPRGLQALQIWQTDVTHVSEFGRLKYVRVSIDTSSSVIVAAAHMGETAKDAIRHWQRAFSVAGVPHSIKTDNGPAYVSRKVATLLQQWCITHVTGILNSPTGQGIVEHAHRTLKQVLERQ